MVFNFPECHEDITFQSKNAILCPIMYSWTEYSITNIFEDEVSVILTTDKLGKFKVSFLFVLDIRRETGNGY